MYDTTSDSHHENDAALLRTLGVDPASVVNRELLPGGMSGARLERLTIVGSRGPEGPAHGAEPEGRLSPTVVPTASGPAAGYSVRVLKQLTPESGWLGALSGDRLLREVRLWSRGVLIELPAGIETGVLAWAERGAATPAGEVAALKGRSTHEKRAEALAARRQGEGRDDGPVAGALLLRDERGHLLRNAVRTPPGHLPVYVVRLLDALARLHARYWCDTRLRDPELGLAPMRAALLLAAPEVLAARVAGGDRDTYLPLALAGWEAFFRLAAPEDAAVLRGVFADPAPVVEAIGTLPWTLAHGDVWGPNLGELPPTRGAPHQGRRALLLDWALTTAGPATYDPLWLCGTWHALAPVRVLAAYRARLVRHLAARSTALAPEVWRTLADAGYLRTALTCGEALGRAAAEAPAGAARWRAETRVRWWAARGARAAGRMALANMRRAGFHRGIRPSRAIS